MTGLITPHEVKQLVRGKWPSTAVDEIKRPLEELRSVLPDAPVMDALSTMARYNLNQLPVISGHHLEGVLSREQLLNYLHTHEDLRKS